METKIYYVEGVEGNSFAIGDIRVAGPKPWGGGRVIAEQKTTVKDILYALNNIYYPPHQPLKTAEDEARMLLHNLSLNSDGEKVSTESVTQP